MTTLFIISDDRNVYKISLFQAVAVPPGPCPPPLALYTNSFIYLFIFDNFVAYIATPSVLQEGGDRLSPPGFPLGPVCVSLITPPPLYKLHSVFRDTNEWTTSAEQQLAGVGRSAGPAR
jgi:hypothetical protein